MRLNRTEQVKKNIAWGLCNKIFFIFFAFALRATIIQTLGTKYLGLDSLFISILQVLNLAEVGFGEAIVYSMYRPIANDDKQLLRKILGFYRKVYFRIGLAILLLGLLVLPALPYLIHDGYPKEINLYILYIIYLINTVISYWMYAYKQSLLNAYMQQYVILNANMFSRLIIYILQIAVLWLTKNFYLYVLLLILHTIINNLTINYYVTKLHPDVICEDSLDGETKRDIYEKIKGIVINKVTGIFRNAMDSIFISAFIGLTAVGIYTNYFLILAGVQSFFSLIYGAYASGVGNSIVLDSKEKNYRELSYMNFFYMWLAGWGTVCLCCLYQPILGLVFGDEMLFPVSTMCLFCLYFYVSRVGDILSLYSRGNGLWWKERYRYIGETILKIFLTFILGYYYGVQGLLLASLLSLLLCGSVWGATITFSNYFRVGLKKYAYLHVVYFVWTVVNATVMYTICEKIDFGLWVDLGLKLVLCFLLPNVLYWLIYRKTNIYTDSMLWLLQRIRVPIRLRLFLLGQ